MSFYEERDLFLTPERRKFEREMRKRWYEKGLAQGANQRAELEARVAELEQKLEDAPSAEYLAQCAEAAYESAQYMAELGRE